MRRSDLSAQALIGVDEIRDCCIRTKDKYAIACIKVTGKDNSLLDDTDNEAVTDRLTTALAEEQQPWQLLSVPRAVDTQGIIRELEAMMGESDNASRRELIQGELAAMREMASSGAREPILFLKIWAAGAEAPQEVLERAALLSRRLESGDINARIMDDRQLLQLCTIYAELGTWQDTDAVPQIPVLPGRQLPWRKEDPEKAAHRALMRQITPVGGVFAQPKELMVGSSWCRALAVTRYPAELPYGWAVKLTGAADSITCITFNPGRAAEIGDALSRSIKDAIRDAGDARDVRERKRLERQSASADRLIDDLDAKGMTLGQMSIVVMPFAESKEKLETVCRAVKTRYAAKKMQIKDLSWLQLSAWKHLSPYYPAQTEIQDVCQRVVPLESLIGGYPMTVSVIRDEHGRYFARTQDRGMLSLDLTCREIDRTNGNGIVTGVPGTGKSTALKHILQSLYMQGAKIIVIDPEREYRDLCKALDGSWWAAGGGGSKVNLLQISPPPPDDEENATYRDNASPLALHMQTVEAVLGYRIPRLAGEKMDLLKRQLLQLYDHFGITQETTIEQIQRRKPREFPTIKHLYLRLVKASQSDDPKSQVYGEIAIALEDMAIGADSEIWNGQTNIDFSNDFVCIDTYQLNNSSKPNKVAQYYNLLLLAFQAMSADPNTPCILICDEAQILFDPEIPQAAGALKNISGRCRKREGYLWLAFHSLQELLDPSVRRDGQAIVDAASYKLLFGTDGRNLQDTAELFKLTRAETKILESKQQRTALALIGSRHLQVVFDIPEYKLRLMGKGGGR